MCGEKDHLKLSMDLNRGGRVDSLRRKYRVSREDLHREMISSEVLCDTCVSERSAPSVTETSKSYIAGLFDGEGSIYIQKSVRKRSTVYALSVRLHNSYSPAIEFCVRETGLGKRVPMKRGSSTPKYYKPMWAWSLKGREAEAVLKMMLPYLIIKRKQAELGIEFFSDRRPRFGGNSKEKRLTDGDLERRQRIKRSIEVENDARFEHE